MQPHPTYHVWTIGCQMNDADTRHAAAQLESAGFTEAARPDEADLILLNTCVVRQQAEYKVYNKLSALQAVKKRRPATRIALMGCLVGMKPRPALMEQFPYVDLFLPPSDLGPLAEFTRRIFQRELPGGRDWRETLQEEEYILPERRQHAVTAHVPIVLGCSHACTYCIIPYRRGRERSRDRISIVREVEDLVRQGVREVVLLGQIVDRYGLDLEPPETLAGLMTEISRTDGLRRIRFLTSHPNFMTDQLIRAVAENTKICPHFEMPFQAGDDEVLKRMRRNYTADQYRERVAAIRAHLPTAAIHTDIIVGFPGETREQFMASYRLLEELQLDKSHIARYSVRPQTYAARRYEDDVPEEEKEERRRLLDELQERILRDKHGKRVGSTVEVLVDGRDEKRGRWRGRTPCDRLVFFEGEEVQIGDECTVKIREGRPYALIGSRI